VRFGDAEEHRRPFRGTISDEADESAIEMCKTSPPRRLGQEEVALAGGDWPAWIEEGGADELAEAMDPDGDQELDDDNSEAE
jgi:hypothetical protein